MFTLADTLGKNGYTNLWGHHTWIPALVHVLLLTYIIKRPSLSLRQSLEGNLILQLLLISAIPMTNNLLSEETIYSQIVTYIILVGCFTFLFHIASRVVVIQREGRNVISRGVYLYLFLLLLIAFEPISSTTMYQHIMMSFANHLGLLPISASILIHLIILPLLCIFPYQFLKNHINKV